MGKVLGWSWFSILLGVVLAAASQEPARGQERPVAVKDARGKTVTLASAPKRIVSLTPANTEMLFALGLGARVVGVTAYCDYPVAAKALPKVGDVNISIEKVLALKPDLVLAGAAASRKALDGLDALPSLHFAVFALEPTTLDESLAAIASLGNLTGCAKRATILVAKLRARIKAVETRVSALRAKPSVFSVVQVDPLWTAGSGTFVDDLIRIAGGTNVGASLGKGYFAVSPERVVAARPNVILAGEESSRRIQTVPGLATTPAVRDSRIYTLGLEASRPGPRLVDALEKLAALIHPVGR